MIECIWNVKLENVRFEHSYCHQSAQHEKKAVREGINSYANQLKPRISTVVIIGSSKSGKTTLIHSFLDNTEEPKASLPIEYTYARRTNKHMSENLDAISILVVLDLSDPQRFFKICDAVCEFYNQKSGESKVITYGFIGTKHDLFEDMDTEKKSIMSQIIQYYVKAVRGNLLFFNKNDRTSVKKVKDLFSSLAFNTKLSNQLKTEIIDPAGQTNASAKNNSEIEFLKHLFTTKFGHREDKSPEDADTTEDVNFINEAIDFRRSNK